MTEYLKQLLGSAGMDRAAVGAAALSCVGSGALAFVGVVYWRWGHWAWIPGGLLALWIILLIITYIYAVHRNKVIGMELDVGIIQHMERREYSWVSGADVLHTEYVQDFTIGDSEEPRPGTRKYTTEDGVTFGNVRAGDQAIIAHSGDKVVKISRRYPESESALVETCRGYASIDGLPARNGTEVTAWIDGVLSGTSTVFGGKGYYGPLLVRERVGISFFYKDLVFVVGNLTADQTSIWTSGETNLDLTVTSSAPTHDSG